MEGTSVEQIQSMVKDFIMREFLPDEDPDELQSGTPLISDGIIDSIAALKLVAFIEETYGIELEAHEADVEHLDSLALIASLVQSKI